MVFSKSFPRTIEGVNYPKWEEVYLDDAEEKEVEDQAEAEHVTSMKTCIREAKAIMASEGLKEYQSDTIALAIALFEKRSSHTIYYKERKAKEKFDQS